MATVFDLFFGTGRSIQAIFKLGFIPRNENYREMTKEELNEYKKTCPDEKDETIYILQRDGKDIDTNGLICISQTERAMLNEGVKVIQHYLQDKDFENDEQAREYVADRMPDVFSKGSRFEQR